MTGFSFQFHYLLITHFGVILKNGKLLSVVTTWAKLALTCYSDVPTALFGTALVVYPIAHFQMLIPCVLLFLLSLSLPLHFWVLHSCYFGGREQCRCLHHHDIRCRGRMGYILEEHFVTLLGCWR